MKYTTHFMVGNTYEGCAHQHKTLIAALNCLVKITRKQGGVMPQYNIWRISYDARGKRKHQACYLKSELRKAVELHVRPKTLSISSTLKPVTTHWVNRFVARVGKTFCGVSSNNLTAYPEKASCLRCRKLAELHGHLTLGS